MEPSSDFKSESLLTSESAINLRILCYSDHIIDLMSNLTTISNLNRYTLKFAFKIGPRNVLLSAFRVLGGNYWRRVLPYADFRNLILLQLKSDTDLPMMYYFINLYLKFMKLELLFDQISLEVHGR